MYDFLVVGAGLFGATFAYEATRNGKSCLVVEKRSHIGGNCYTEEESGIIVHKYGPHIFRTNKKHVWDFVNQFAEFNRFTNCPIAKYGDEVYNLPFNMNTFYQLFGISNPIEAQKYIEEQRVYNPNPKNAEEKALSLVGPVIYEKLIKGYTEKQWGRPCTELTPDIISRIPLRFTFDNNYFNDRYQGIPIGGYTPIFQQLLNGSHVRLGVDFVENKDELIKLARTVVYTGMADRLFDYKFGTLPYRSLRFEEIELNVPNRNGNAVVNFTKKDVPFTRIIEHKHFEWRDTPTTILTAEHPQTFENAENSYPFYPITNEESLKLHRLYQQEAEAANIVLGGRVGMYSYDDMDVVIDKALTLAGKLIK